MGCGASQDVVPLVSKAVDDAALSVVGIVEGVIDSRLNAAVKQLQEHASDKTDVERLKQGIFTILNLVYKTQEPSASSQVISNCLVVVGLALNSVVPEAISVEASEVISTHVTALEKQLQMENPSPETCVGGFDSVVAAMTSSLPNLLATVPDDFKGHIRSILEIMEGFRLLESPDDLLQDALNLLGGVSAVVSDGGPSDLAATTTAVAAFPDVIEIAVDGLRAISVRSGLKEERDSLISTLVLVSRSWSMIEGLSGDHGGGRVSTLIQALCFSLVSILPLLVVSQVTREKAATVLQQCLDALKMMNIVLAKALELVIKPLDTVNGPSPAPSTVISPTRSSAVKGKGEKKE